MIRLASGATDSRSAGSFFKNPIVPAPLFAQIAQNIGKEPPHFPAPPDPQGQPQVKIPAAWLIEQAGFPKGYTLGRAALSTRHTLALTNLGQATSDEVLALAQKIRSTVLAHFGIHLEMEPVLLGF
jgi:UDP-N-acetylmuramate dehydrogenase